MSNSTVAALGDLANRLRIHSIESTSAAGSGHPTSCCSMAEIMAVLFFDVMRYRVHEPRNPNNDRFVLSKGHAAPILYAAWAEAGAFSTSELVRLRKIDSDLEGHPTPRLPFVDVATGSLGQGLSAGCGMAYAARHLDGSKARVYVLLGDGESAEGSVWEALAFASQYRLDNLVAIFDVNRLGQSDPTMLQHDLETYRRRLDAFGWNALVVDGHDVTALREAFERAETCHGKPTALVARTWKGRGIPGVEDQDDWHGKPLGERTQEVVEHLRGQMTGAYSRLFPFTPKAPAVGVSPHHVRPITMPAPAYERGQKVATRAAYGTVLARLGSADPRIVALDGDTKNSTYSDKFRQAHPARFIECYIAEQNLVGVAAGLASQGKIPFASTFACFLTRAFDQVRMAGISRLGIKLVGSHAGVSIGADGPSQMGLEDLAMFRTVPGCVVFYPSDAVATEQAVLLAANHSHMAYIRTSRPATPVLYANDEPFAIGRAKVVRSSSQDQVTVIGAGITLHEALAAAARLQAEGIPIRVIDPFTIKPIDRETFIASARQTGGKVLAVEDHYPEGGLGDAVAAALADEPGIAVRKLAVGDVPRSGEPHELLARFGIDAAHIAQAVRDMVGPAAA